jgi:uncharacterized protein YbjT (DUF2867 family)
MLRRKILVVGGTGYVGTRLVAKLLDEGYQVRVTWRSNEKIRNKIWFKHPNLETIQADALSRISLEQACKGCSVVYYLVHCMYPNHDNFLVKDKLAAENMVYAANKSELEHIIYLGGMGGQLQNASKHLKSRAQVGEILRRAQIPVTILQAAMIIGSGSLSFEMLRYTVERLPIMITPKWIHSKSQPIAIRNVIDYLVRCLKIPKTIGKTFDIGGPEILTYKRLMEVYAEEASLKKRLVISLPFNDPLQSSAYFLSFITPINISITKPLVEGLRNKTICQNNEISQYIPQELLSPREAIRRSIEENKQIPLNEFQSNGKSPPVEWSHFGDPIWAGGSVNYDRWAAVLEGDINDIWKTICSIGGGNGWYHANLLWRLRGYVDEFVGGPGMRRGRKHCTNLNQGEILDCWRVTRVKEFKELLLTAEMKLPGFATLNFKLKENGKNHIIIDQIAYFIPKGLWGLAYAQLVLPFHKHVFTGMIKGIAKNADCKIIYGPKYIPIREKI